MHREIILRAFSKAKGEEIKETGIIPSPNKCAARLSFIIEQDNINFTYHKRSLSKLYKSALNETVDDIAIKQPQVVQTLCVYLGFDNYEDFILQTRSKRNTDGDNKGRFPTHIESKNNEDVNGSSNIPESDTLNGARESSDKAKTINVKMKILISVVIITILAVVIITGVNRQKYMIWEETHYVKTSFDATKVQNGSLKLYKEDRIENFRKITPDSTYAFFNKDGSVRVWYGKNSSGELEFFTSYGLHPETNKTLKPITNYMINKYIRN